MEFLNKIRPAVDKPWLIFVAGLMWSAVGVFLCSLAIGWWIPEEIRWALLFAFFGGILALTIYRLGFSKLADKNIRRIDAYQKTKICIFAFQEWTSYPLVIFMISLGIFLRKFSPIPKPYLGVLYLGIGLSLFLSSLHYYRQLITHFNPKRIQKEKIPGK
ncbi:MAG: hypothetical protein MUO76_02025, partial [Anaerolineaceae bacterium]|nr:hypothetical protein [Anaerolineaceae bacterium]